jgi:DNA polymerase elongation subunit (family B)
MKILMLDIETAPHQSYTWGLFDQNVGLSQLIKPGYILCWGASWHHEQEPMFGSIFDGSRKRMLKGIHSLLSEADVVVGWNSQAFDIPWIQGELIQNDFDPPVPFKQVDLFRVSRSQFRFASNKLQFVAPLLTQKEKIKTDFDLWTAVMAGDERACEKMRKYCMQDVHMLHDIYDKMLPWIRNHPAHHPGPDGEIVCRNCGSKHIHRRGTTKTNAGEYTLYQCQGCGKYGRTVKNILDNVERAAILREV